MCALVTGVQSCALPIYAEAGDQLGLQSVDVVVVLRDDRARSGLEMVDGAPALEDVARIGAEMDHVRSGHRHLAIEFDTESPADAAAASVAAGEECAADRLDRAGLRIADLHRHAITILIDYALECG